MSGAPPQHDPYLSHWADIAARRTLAAHPGLERYTVAAGITPSGVVHIGNFREVITVDLVARALRDHGADVRFIYSWDDFDVFRKVPKGMPQPELLASHLRRSIADVPDPFGEHDSYASHNIAAFEASLAPLGIAPEFIRQHRRYRAGDYASGIRRALEQRDVLRGILDRSREATGDGKKLPGDWLPLAGFCGACGRDELDLAWDGEWGVEVRCRDCGHVRTVDLREGGDLKLPWRIDWPMRWAHERVVFEPGGKDHSSAGGSYDTGKDIVREVYGWQAPEYVGYDFVSIKGRGGKISSSSGDVVTVADALEVFEPPLLRWLFASYRPNTEFAISFDLDVIKLYEEFDRAVRLAHEPEDGSRDDKKRQAARRTLHLASVDHQAIAPGAEPPRVVGFRPASVVLQIVDGDIDRAIAHLERDGAIAGAAERAAFRARAACVWRWIETYAPEDFRYRIRREPVVRDVGGDAAVALGRLVAALRARPDASDAELGETMRTLAEGTAIELKGLYPLLYDLLLDRDRGPKLSTLLATMGSERALALLGPSVPDAAG
jgi:lysyl-tRNA synthetase class 1